MRAFEKIIAVRKIQGLTATQKLILLTIASHLGKNDFCYLSITTILKETCLVKRNAVIDNIQYMIDIGILWKLLPGDGFKSNRYGIDFVRLVTVGYQCSNLGLPDQSLRVTEVVTEGYPNRNIKEKEKIIKEKPFNFSVDKKQEAASAREAIRKVCRLRSRESDGLSDKDYGN